MEKTETNTTDAFEDCGLDHLTREELDQAHKDYDEHRQVSYLYVVIALKLRG